MAGLLYSVLEEVIKSFGGQAFKKQTIINALKNRGVKDIEIEQSGIKKFVEEYKGDKVPVEELNKVLETRKDKIETFLHEKKQIVQIMQIGAKEEDKKEIESLMYIVQKNPRDFEAIKRLRGLINANEIRMNAGTNFNPGALTNEDVLDRGLDLYTNSDAFANKRFKSIREKEFSDPYKVPYETLDTAHIHRAEAANALRRLNDPVLTEQYGEANLRQILKDTSNKGQGANSTSIRFRPQDIEATIDKAIAQYKETMLPNKQEGKYTAKVFTKDIDYGLGVGKGTGVSTHFNNVPNYYAHGRYTDYNEGNRSIRNVHEVQSDVHVGDKISGIASTEYEDKIHDLATQLYDKHIRKLEDQDLEDIPDAALALVDIFRRGNPPSYNTLKTIMDNTKGKDAWSPAELNKLGKDINFSLAELAGMPRGQKFAKQEENYLTSTLNKMIVDSANEGKNVFRVRIKDDTNLGRSKGVAEEFYPKQVVGVLKTAAKQMKTKVEMTDDGYAEIVIPDYDFKLPLYSATGIGVLTASQANKAQAEEFKPKIQQALDAGYSHKEIYDSFKAKGTDLNLVDRMLNPDEGLITQDDKFNTMLNRTAQGL